MTVEVIDYLIESHICKTETIFDSLKSTLANDDIRVFELFRVNYFHRTRNTIPSLSRLLMSSLERADFLTASLIGQNIYEETGEGDSLNSHIHLLEQCFNQHGSRVFNLPEIKIIDSEEHPLLTTAAKKFILEQNKAYSNSQYSNVLAVSYAQETVANRMLKKILEVFFVPYQHYYSGEEFSDLTEYFNCHINGLEERHALDMRDSLIRNCQNVRQWQEANDQVTSFLNAQLKLWSVINETCTKELAIKL